MREILFKAKRVDNGEWVEGYLFDNGFSENRKMFVGSFVIEEYRGYADDDWDIIGGDFYEVDVSTICQCTGLTDKNGQKIWENDYVEIVEEDDDPYVIEWNEDTAKYSLVQCGSLMYDFDNYWSYEVEVIGNKFDTLI